MWWLEVPLKVGRALRVASILAAAGLVAGCFQPLYGDRGATGGSAIRAELSQVEVAQISAPNGTALARLAVEVRNALLFGFTGGSSAPPPTHRLTLRLVGSELSVAVDIRTGRPDVNNFALTATYELLELRTGKVVVRDQTFARVSYDIPGQEQRFARARGLRDAESRAGKVIADNIQARLASYFIAGT